MKPKEGPTGSALTKALEREVEKVKQEIDLQAKGISENIILPKLDETVAKIKKEIEREFSEALNTLGLETKRIALLREIEEARNSQDQLVQLNVEEKLKRFMEELENRLPTAPNYSSLKKKREMLKYLTEAKCYKETEEKKAALKTEVHYKYNEILDRPYIKQKFESLRAEILESGISEFEELDDGVKERLVGLRREVEVELANFLKSLDLEVKIVKSSESEFSEEIYRKIQEGVDASPDLENKIELLRSLQKKAGKSASTDQQAMELEQQIKESIENALRTKLD